MMFNCVISSLALARYTERNTNPKDTGNALEEFLDERFYGRANGADLSQRQNRGPGVEREQYLLPPILRIRALYGNDPVDK